MREYKSLWLTVDWLLILLYAVMIIVGWLNIYAAIYDTDIQQRLFDLSHHAGKQLLWIALGVGVLVPIIMLLDYQVFERLAIQGYIVVLLMLVLVLVVGVEINGARAWFDFGFMKLQPAEFAKLAVCLALARLLNDPKVQLTNFRVLLSALLIIFLPAALIVVQGDAGSALVFAVFIFVLYREGFWKWVFWLGLWLFVVFIFTLYLRDWLRWDSEEARWYFWAYLVAMAGVGVTLSLLLFFLFKRDFPIATMTLIFTLITLGSLLLTDFLTRKVLQPHQLIRIEVLFNPDKDPRGAGWHTRQSQIAISSGNISGRGYLKGTQTKLDYIPKQSTDFIFCTMAEEHGWVGSLTLVGLFAALVMRVFVIAERQKDRFVRVYAYGVGSIFFYHFMVNIGMTIGLIPVIGIPLPFFSYGGSSFWSFTLLLFILIKLDAHRMQLLGR